MATSDGSVEIRITGAIDPSVAASAQAAKSSVSDLGASVNVSAATMAKALEAVGGDMSKLTPEMLGIGEAAGEAAATTAAATGTITAGMEVATKATTGMSHASAGVTRELIVMAREAGRGDFSRMAGSATILASRLGLLTPEVMATGIAVAGIVAPIAVAAAAMEAHAQDVAKFRNAIQLTGNYAGLTASAYENMAARIAAASNTGIGRARESILALASSGRFTSQEIEDLAGDAAKFSMKTGESFDKVLAEFIKMSDGPTRYAETFVETYRGAITPAQIEHISNLEAEGYKTAATAALVQDLTHWLRDQSVQMGTLAGDWHTLGGAIDFAWEAMKRFASGGSEAQKLESLNKQIAAQKGNLGGAGGELLDSLERQRDALMAVMAAEQREASTATAATRAQAEAQDAYDKSSATMKSLRSSAVAAREAVKALHDEMAIRLKNNPNDKEALDYQANSGKYDEALRRKMDPGDFKKPKDDEVQVWREQLQRKLEDEKAYFADSKAEQLKWWQDHLSETKKGSTAEFEVNHEIYTLSREIAQQTYRDKIASYDREIEAAKGNWAKQKGLMADELKYIKSVQDEKSSAVEEAERKNQEAARAQAQTMFEIQRSNTSEALAELKSNLDTQRAIRDADEKSAESAIKGTPQYQTPVGKVQGDMQIATMHQQMLQQQMAADQTYHAAQDQMMQDEINMARLVDGEMSDAYVKAVNAKKLADLQFANQNKLLSDQMVNRAKEDAEKIKQDWHQTIDPMVSVTSNQIKGLIEGTETWGRALAKIGDQALDLVIEAIERMVEQWIVNTIVGTAATKTSAMSGAAAYAGMAGAAGVASMAAAPFPFDLDAPAFGASMAATAMALGSFAQGVDVVPHDMIAQIHEGERIMPAADNSKLMGALSGGGVGGNGQKGSDIHMHYAPSYPLENRSLGDMLATDGHMMKAWLKDQARSGALKKLMG